MHNSSKVKNSSPRRCWKNIGFYQPTQLARQLRYHLAGSFNRTAIALLQVSSVCVPVRACVMNCVHFCMEEPRHPLNGLGKSITRDSCLTFREWVHMMLSEHDAIVGQSLHQTDIEAGYPHWFEVCCIDCRLTTSTLRALPQDRSWCFKPRNL